MSESLLSAEQAIHDLLKNLQELKSQTEGYSAARGALQDTSSSLTDLISDTKILYEKALGATVALREIGTPEILEKSGEIVESVNEVMLGIQGLSTSLNTQQETVGNITQSLSHLQEQAEGDTKQLKDKADEIHNLVSGKSDKIYQNIIEIQKQNEDQSTALREELAAYQRIVADNSEQQNKKMSLLTTLIIVGVLISAISLI